MLKGQDGCKVYGNQMDKRELKLEKREVLLKQVIWDAAFYPHIHAMGAISAKAFIWYQGESDKQWQNRYHCLQKQLVRQVPTAIPIKALY